MSRSVSAPSSVTNTSPCWNGDIVPGSTFRYGSNFRTVIRRPRSASRRPSDAAAIPFPSDETTPPVTKMYLVVWGLVLVGMSAPSSGERRPARVRLGEIVFGVDPGVHLSGHVGDADRYPGRERPQLLQTLDSLQRVRREGDPRR